MKEIKKDNLTVKIFDTRDEMGKAAGEAAAEKIKEIILDMAANITELEYFGFDVAVTEDSVKLPEINRFPDFPKIEKYSQETIDYLLLKLQQKKEKYGYDVKPCRKLVHLPKGIGGKTAVVVRIVHHFALAFQQFFYIIVVTHADGVTQKQNFFHC